MSIKIPHTNGNAELIKSRIHRGTPQSGFVLAEALVALAISGAVLLGLFTLTDLISRHARGISERVEAAESIGRSLAAVAREIGLTQRLRWAGRPEARPFIFVGSADTLLFALDGPIDGPNAPTRAVQIQSSTGTRGGQILRAEADLPPTVLRVTDLAFEPARVLYRGRWRLRFAYIAAASASTPEMVFDDWDLPDAMPVAVRLSLADSVSGISALEMRVPLRIEAEAGCVVPDKGYCSLPTDQASDGDASTAAIVNALQGRRP